MDLHMQAGEDTATLICRLCDQPIGGEPCSFDPAGKRGADDPPKLLHKHCLLRQSEDATRRLHNAAPAMLAALKDMVAGYDDTMKRYGHGAGDVKAARAAIRKAETKSVKNTSPE